MATWNLPMLFTRCPDCQTNFRITAEALRKADGQVKCGHCAAVFNAYEALRDDSGAQHQAPLEEEPTEVEFDSLSETDEYYGLREDEPAESLGEYAIEEAEAEEVEPEEFLPDEADAHHETAQSEDEPLPPATEPTLEFNLPQDEWTTFFEHAAGQPLSDDLPQSGGTLEPPTGDPRPEHSEQEVLVEEIVIEAEAEEVGEPAFADDDADNDNDTENDVFRIIEVPDSDEAAAQLDESDSSAMDPPPESSGVFAELDSAEEMAATPSYEEEDSGAAPTKIGRVEMALELRDKLVSSRWVAGSLLLSTLLMVQVVHHFRAPLAGQPVVGPLLRGAYAMAGAELTPEWDLSQYEIMDWVATAAAETEGPGTLQISARIHNRGPRAQPYPSVRLELKDRWEATVGSRVFTADEYLPEDVTQERVMDAGSTVPASLALVDPGQDAYGFELDICAEVSAGGLRCASDTVFQ